MDAPEAQTGWSEKRSLSNLARQSRDPDHPTLTAFAAPRGDAPVPWDGPAGLAMTMQQLYLAVPLVPLVASIIVGLWGRKMPRAASHWITILAVAVSFVPFRTIQARETE